MTAPGWAPQTTGGFRCVRCGRTQPPLPRGVFTCVYCSAPLPAQRWRADPPPGVQITAPLVPRSRAYLGPPSYRGGHPRWGFPTVVWRTAEIVGTDSGERAPLRGLRIGSALAGSTAIMCLLAAGAETWRYLLMLRGRTEVLAGGVVEASNRLLYSAGVAVFLALAAALVLVPTLVSLHGVAARRAGAVPSRRPASVLARLVIPIWNVYGAGQMLSEIDGTLAAGSGVGTPAVGTPAHAGTVVGRPAVTESDNAAGARVVVGAPAADSVFGDPADVGTIVGTPAVTRAGNAAVARAVVGALDSAVSGKNAQESIANLASAPGISARPRVSFLVTGWWLAWFANAILVVITLGLAFGRSPQAIADTVELHIAVDALGAVVAGLTAAQMLRFTRRLVGRTADPYVGWRVAGPEPTSDRGLASKVV